MREVLLCVLIDTIIGITLVVLKILGIILWSWWLVILSVLFIIPTIMAIVMTIPILFIIYNNTK